MKIDLRKIPSITVSARKFDGRRRRLAWYLENDGMMPTEFVSCELHARKRFPSITLSHIAAISGRRCPFILFEDDATPTEYFRPLIDAPKGAAAVWLGITTFGPGETHEERSVAARAWGDPKMPRVAQMFGTHAILFLSEKFRITMARRLFTWLVTSPGKPHDICTAKMQEDFRVYATNPPLYRQDDGHLDVTSRAVAVTEA